MNGIIHFGMLKTGSSSIQQTLYHLKSRGDAAFSYLTLDEDYNLNRMVRLLYKADAEVQIAEKRDGIAPGGLAAEQARIRETIDKQLSEARGKVLVASSEIFPTMDETDLSGLRAQFTAAGLSPRAVGYVRRPKAFLESLFQQRVKGAWNSFSLAPMFPRYRSELEKFDRVFGRENVRFWLFEPAAFPQNCVVRHFASQVGITISAEDVRQANTSVSLPALTLLFAHRKYLGEAGGNPNTLGNRLLIRKMRELKGAKPHFHSSLIAPLLEQFKDEIAWMEERMGASLAEDLTAHDAVAIRTERELLAFAPGTLQWLSESLGEHPLASSVSSGDPEAVAKGVDALYYLQLGDRPNTVMRRNPSQAGPRVKAQAAPDS